jgi:hypothetical protein
MVAPLRPPAEQRADRRSKSLDASGPDRMISGTIVLAYDAPQTTISDRRPIILGR